MTFAPRLAVPALLAALAATAPAAAAPYATDGNALRRDIAQLDRQIDRLQDRRALSPREANYLEREVNQLQRNWSQYSRNGFNAGERHNLSAQIRRVEHAVSRHARDRNNRVAYRW